MTKAHNGTDEFASDGIDGLRGALRETNERVDRRFDEVDRRFDEVDRRFDEVDRRFDEVDRRFDEVDRKFDEVDRRFDENAREHAAFRRDIAELKGMATEVRYHQAMVGIFGRWLRGGHDARNAVADRLYEAAQRGAIDEDEIDNALRCDLVWGGRLRISDDHLYLVIEASYVVESTDVARARDRADVLRRAGLRAVPVAAGQRWASPATALAETLEVVRLTDGSLDSGTWRSALVS
jgi:hypothetical protein